MARQIRSFEEFKSQLGDEIFDCFNDCILQGYYDQEKLIVFNGQLDCFVELDLALKAKFMNVRISGRLENAFKNNPNVKIDKLRQLVLFTINDDFIIRQNKFKSGGRIAKSKTEQYRLFMNQSKLLPLSDSATFIVAGYMMNKHNTEMLGVYFACYSADGLEWFTKVGEFVHEQKRIDFDKPITAEVKKKLTTTKKKLTKLKIVSRKDDLKTINENKEKE